MGGLCIVIGRFLKVLAPDLKEEEKAFLLLLDQQFLLWKDLLLVILSTRGGFIPFEKGL